MSEIRVEGLVHVYPDGGVRALDGVDLRIGAGERVALVGQNGSGKTTLARHLNGLLRPTEGSVSVEGVDAATLTVAQLASRVGLVFQDPDRQIFAGSVRAEVEFGPVISAAPGRSSARRSLTLFARPAWRATQPRTPTTSASRGASCWPSHRCSPCAPRCSSSTSRRLARTCGASSGCNRSSSRLPPRGARCWPSATTCASRPRHSSAWS